MKKLMLIVLAALLAGGCSLTGDDAPDGAAGLRLLVGDNRSKTVSDPKANDWSPQMVYVGTNRYLYFLSDREFTGNSYSGNGNWFGTAEKSPGTQAIFRAREIQAGVFSNIQMYYEFPPDTTVQFIVSEYSNSHNPVIHYASRVNATNQPVRFLEWGSSTPGGGDSISGNTNLFFSGGRLFHEGVNNYFLGEKIPTRISANSFDITILNQYEGNLENLFSMENDSLISIQQKSGSNIGVDFMRDKDVLDAWPAIFLRPTDEKKCFGFYVSYGGMLTVLLYRQFGDFNAYQNNEGLSLISVITNSDMRQSIIALPLLRVTHYAGTIDRNPSYDPATGLYFSSNRDGKYNLYLVPKELLYLPEWLEMPDPT